MNSELKHNKSFTIESHVSSECANPYATTHYTRTN